MTGATAVIVAVLLLIFVWDLSASQTQNRVEAERYAAEYAAQAESRIADSCTMTEPVALAQCIREIIEAAHEHQRSEADLAAQRDMAKWALGMIVISGAGVLVTAAGVVYVALTLGEARKTTHAAIVGANAAAEANRQARMKAMSDRMTAMTANRISQRNGEAQVRAYLSATGGTYEIWGRNVHLEIALKNAGQSPARNISCNWFIEFQNYRVDRGNLAFDDEVIDCGFSRGNDISAAATGVMPGVLDQDSAASERMDIFFRHIEMHVGFRLRCVIGWRDVFDNNLTETFHLVSQAGEPQTIVDGTDPILTGSFRVDNWATHAGRSS